MLDRKEFNYDHFETHREVIKGLEKMVIEYKPPVKKETPDVKTDFNETTLTENPDETIADNSLLESNQVIPKTEQNTGIITILSSPEYQLQNTNVSNNSKTESPEPKNSNKSSKPQKKLNIQELFQRTKQKKRNQSGNSDESPKTKSLPEAYGNPGPSKIAKLDTNSNKVRPQTTTDKSIAGSQIFPIETEVPGTPSSQLNLKSVPACSQNTIEPVKQKLNLNDMIQKRKMMNKRNQVSKSDSFKMKQTKLSFQPVTNQNVSNCFKRKNEGFDLSKPAEDESGWLGAIEACGSIFNEVKDLSSPEKLHQNLESNRENSSNRNLPGRQISPNSKAFKFAISNDQFKQNAAETFNTQLEQDSDFVDRKSNLEEQRNDLDGEIDKLYHQNYRFQTTLIKALSFEKQNEINEKKHNWLGLRRRKDSVCKELEQLEQREKAITRRQMQHADLPLESLENGLRLLEGKFLNILYELFSQGFFYFAI